MEHKSIFRAARKCLLGQTKSIGYGYNLNTSSVTYSTPVILIDGDSEPILYGQPYWKNTIRNGPRFSKTLYTRSSMHIEVGKDWKF